MEGTGLTICRITELFHISHKLKHIFAWEIGINFIRARQCMLYLRFTRDVKSFGTGRVFLL